MFGAGLLCLFPAEYLPEFWNLTGGVFVTMLPGYQVTRLPGYQVTRLPGYQVTGRVFVIDSFKEI